MLDAIDPDFIPMQVLNNVINPMSYIKERLVNYVNTSNISYIKDINNNYLDTLLKDLMPFIFYKGKAGKVLTTALEQYAKAMTEHSKHYLEELKNILRGIKILQEMLKIFFPIYLRNKKISRIIIMNSLKMMV